MSCDSFLAQSASAFCSILHCLKHYHLWDWMHKMTNIKWQAQHGYEGHIKSFISLLRLVCKWPRILYLTYHHNSSEKSVIFFFKFKGLGKNSNKTFHFIKLRKFYNTFSCLWINPLRTSVTIWRLTFLAYWVQSWK